MKLDFINNRYKIIKKIGEGSMGEGYLAEDILKYNQLIAIKVIKKEMINFSNLENFKREFDLMARLNHPNLVKVYDFGFDSAINTFFITMEYVQGLPLDKLIKKSVAVSQKKLLEMMVSLARTLEFIHSRNILHRDIKPENIMFACEQEKLLSALSVVPVEIKLLDFGLSDLGYSEKTKVKGTLFYLAPEILSEKYDHRADIYSLGITFYELLTLEHLWAKVTSASIFDILRTESLFQKNVGERLEKIAENSLREIVAKMIAYSPEDRYQSLSEFILDINEKLSYSFPLETEETRRAYVLGAAFVGREQELEKVKTKVKHGSPENNSKMTFVIGRIGTGKSRLFEEFKKFCQLRDIFFVESKCYKNGAREYAPIIEILHHFLLNSPKDLILKYGSELKKLIPFNKRLENIKANKAQDSKTEKSLLIKNITNFILNYTKNFDKEIVLTINDVHWADEGSLTVLMELLYQISIRGIPNLHIFASAREEELQRLEYVSDTLREKGRLEEIVLKPFDVKDVEEYINSIFGESRIGEELKNSASAIQEKIGGNPLFLQELIKSLVERGLIYREKAKWELAKSIEEVEFPINLREIIQNRLKKLDFSEKEQKFLDTFALLNKSIALEEFRLFTEEKNKEEIKRFFTKLEKQELVLQEEMGKQIQYRFSNSLIRELIAENVENDEGLHSYIAHKIEEIFGDNIEEFIDELAYHYSNTKERDKALYYLEKAGENASQVFSNLKAINYYGMILKLLKEEEIQKKAEILYKKGDLVFLIGRWENALKVYKKSWELAEAAGDEYQAAKSMGEYAYLLYKKGNLKEAEDIYDQALAIFRKLGEKKDEGITLVGIGMLYHERLDYEKAKEYYTEALKIYEKIGAKKRYCRALFDIGGVYGDQGNHEKALEYDLKSLKIAEEIESKLDIMTINGNIGANYGNKGETEKSIEWQLKALDIAWEIGDRSSASWIMGNLGLEIERIGDYQKAREYFRKKLEIDREVGNLKGVSRALGFLADLYIESEEYEKAKEYYDEAFTAAEKYGLKYEISSCYGNYSFFYQVLGKYDEAIRFRKKQLEFLEGYEKFLHLSYAEHNFAEIYFEMKEYAKAKEHFNKNFDLAKKINHKKSISFACYGFGKIAKAQKDFEEAENWFDKSIELIQEFNDDSNLSEFLYHKAETYFEKGNLEDARKINHRAKELSEKGHNKEIAVFSKILGYKIEYLQSEDSGVKGEVLQKLRNMANKSKKRRNVALINYELYNLTQEDFYAKRSMEIYEELYKETPRVIFKDKIEKLERELEKNKKLRLEKIKKEQERSCLQEEATIYPDPISFLEIIGAISSNIHLGELLQNIVERLISLTRMERAFVILVNRNKALEVKATKNIDYQVIESDDFALGKEIIEKVEKSKETIFIRDAAGYFGEKSENYEIESIVCLPFISGKNGELLGLIYFDSYSYNCLLTEWDEKFLIALSDQVSKSLENALLYEKIEEDREHFERLFKVGKGMNSVLDLNELLTMIVDSVIDIVGAERGFLMLNADGLLEFEIARDRNKENLEKTDFGISFTIANRVLEEGESILLANIEKDAELRPTMSMVDLNLKSLLCVPLKIGRQVFGLIYVDNSIATSNFTENELNLLTMLSGQAAIAIEKTGLYNKLEEKVELLAYSNEQLRNLKEQIEILLRATKEMTEAKDSISAVKIALKYMLEEIPLDDEEGLRLYMWDRTNQLSFYALDEDADLVASENFHEENLYINNIVNFGKDTLIPIRRGGTQFALICFKNTRLDSEKQNFVENISNSLALVLSNLRFAEQEKLAVIGQMASEIIHDFKQPIQLVMGYADFMRDFQVDPKTQKKNLNIILQASKRIVDMVSDVLDFSKGKMSVEIERFSLKEYMEDIVEYLEVTFRNRNIEIECELLYEGEVALDKRKFRRVIQNIAVNAVEAMEEGGKILIKALRQDKNLVFLFSDNGPGIPAEVQKNIFEPFSTARKSQGTGLGMAIVRRIVEEHGGVITFETEKDKGTTFRIVLPQDREE